MTFLRLYVLRTFWYTSAICIVYSNLRDSSRPKKFFYYFRSGLTQRQCIDKLNSIFGDEAPSRTSIYRWYGEFTRGRSSLQDEFREGRPKSVVVPETIVAVHQLILQDPHVTYCEIEKTLGISGTKKIYSHWIPHNLQIAQKKGSCRLIERNAQKIHSRCFETRLRHRDMWWIVDLRVWARK